MDNPTNKFLTKEDVEKILNFFVNIGDNGVYLQINNVDIYQRAFVHESYYQSVQNTILNQLELNERYMLYIPKESNERLEFLGDHILKTILAKYLFERFPEEREGFLTKLKIKIEKCSSLHKIAVKLGFKKFLLLSLQVENQTILDIDRGRATPSFYEDAFEAFLGSIVQDFGEKGYIYAERFVRQAIQHIIDFSEIISVNDNFKDSLQRYFQSNKWKTPMYIEVNEEGPLYRKIFSRIVLIHDKNLTELAPSVNKVISKYTHECLLLLKQNEIVFNKVMKEINNGYIILGIGYGRKVIQAEQDAAKNGLLNLNLNLDF